MLRISKLTDYATVILSYLAVDPVNVLSATSIAEATHLAIPTVSKILKILSTAGLVHSFRGAGGGYQLAKPASQITLAHVVTAVEGNIAMTECCTPNGACMVDTLCSIKENWQRVNHVILQALASLTLSDMTQPLKQHTPLLHGIPIKADSNMTGLRDGK